MKNTYILLKIKGVFLGAPEIAILIALFFVLVTNLIYAAKHLVQMMSAKSTKMDGFLDMIKDTIDIDLSCGTKTVEDIKKIIDKKEKLLHKMKMIILKISMCAGIETQEISMTDDIANRDITIPGFDSDVIRSTSYFGDYLFVFATMGDIITRSEFPDKETLLKLNDMYRTYDELSESKNNKLCSD